ncbi:hypothetical protein Syun_016221 [Stephania yunnanensis]|uniref:Uncharacterized protein n=1 Tax=Stephania yunnanensis TaxID=152371 RepID=A0AAP0J4M1_9MAGN
MASSWFGSSGATPHTMTMTNTPATRLLPMSQVRSSKLVLGLVAGSLVPEMLRMPLEELCLQIKSLSLGYIRPFLMRLREVVEKVAEGVEENTICLIFDHFSRFREMRGYRFVVLLIGCRTLRIS